MFYQENSDQDSSLPKFTLYSHLQDGACTLESNSEEYWLNGNLENSVRKAALNNQFQLLGNQSFHTIPRNSLKILPDPYSMQIGQDKFIVPLKNSNNSILVGSDDEDQAQLQTRLITETQQMTINDNDDDQISPLQFGLLGTSHREIPKHQNQKLSKSYSVKQIGSLLRQLNRRHKYQDKTKGHFIIRTESQLITVKQAHVKLVVQKKGIISGLLIESKDQRLKIKVIDQPFGKNKVFLQFWRQAEQNWIQATLAAKLKCIKNQQRI